MCAPVRPMRHILHGRRFRLAFKVLGYNHSGRAQRRRHDRGMKLLLVEDDFDLAGALSRSLVARGFEVLCCADGKEALAAARRTAFDVITLDLSLPGLDGLEELLRLLMSRIDRVVSKEELRTQVFANTDEQVQADAVEVVVHRLRKKLVGTNAEIVTLRGVGYLLCDADSMAAQKGDKVDKAEKGGALR